MKKGKSKDRPETLLLSEVQVLLAEKRTFFSILRTGLAVITVPLTVIVFLIASKEYHNIFSRFWLSAIVIGFLLAISLTGLYLVLKSGKKINKIDRLIRGIEKEDKRVNKLVVD